MRRCCTCTPRPCRARSCGTATPAAPRRRPSCAPPASWPAPATTTSASASPPSPRASGRGRLKVLSTACWNLIAESKLYRYPTNDERSVLGEKPIDDNNHALGALRYLISKLDYKFIAKLRKKAPKEGPIESDSVEAAYDEQLEETHRSVYGAKTWSDPENNDVWTTLQ